MSMPNMRKAAALIVQGNPIFGMRLDTMIGKMTPPSDEPDAMMPNAVARFLKNQVPTELVAAVKIAAAPKALQNPCAKKN